MLVTLDAADVLMVVPEAEAEVLSITPATPVRAGGVSYMVIY